MLKIKDITILILVALLYSYKANSQSTSIESIAGKYQSANDKYRDIKEFKEFKNDGTYESHKIDDKQDVIINSGRYIVVNDSIYLECVEYSPNAKHLEGQVLPFKYNVKNDSLRQTGIIYNPLKSNTPKPIYYKYLVDGYWLKVN